MLLKVIHYLGLGACDYVNQSDLASTASQANIRKQRQNKANKTI